jgi:MFS family permease
MDRFTLAGILDKIQCAFDISNGEAGLLQTVFVVSYMIFAPLFGYLGDRYSRKYIMAGGVFLWSLTTFLGSYMEVYGAFIAFRAMVGIGEASYSTIAPTIISDMFVGKVRSRMLALFYFAIPVGSGLGYIVGSETAKAGGSWHYGLRVTPVMGALAVILILFVLIEPPRGESEGGSHLEATSWGKDLRYLLRNPSFMLSTLGFTCVAFVTGALAWWGPTFIKLGIESQNEGTGEADMGSVAYTFGAITMVSGLLGVPLGSWLSTRLKKKNPRADPLICAFGLLTSTPLIFLASVVARYNTIACYTLIFFGELFLNLNWSIVADMLLYVVIPTRRSTAEAFQILISHMFGDAGSPYLIGQTSEWIKSHISSQNVTLLLNATAATAHTIVEESKECGLDVRSDDPIADFRSLQYSLFITSFVEVLGGLCFLMTAWYIISDKTKADKAIGGDELMRNEGSHPEMHEADELSSSSSSLS